LNNCSDKRGFATGIQSIRNKVERIEAEFEELGSSNPEFRSGDAEPFDGATWTLLNQMRDERQTDKVSAATAAQNATINKELLTPYWRKLETNALLQ